MWQWISLCNTKRSRSRREFIYILHVGEFAKCSLCMEWDEKRTIESPKGLHLEHPQGLRDCRELQEIHWLSVYVVRSLQMSTLRLWRHQIGGLNKAHWQERVCELKNTRLNYKQSNPCFCVVIIGVNGSFIFVVATIGMYTEVSSHKSSSGCSRGHSYRYEEFLRWRWSPKRHKHAFFGWTNWRQSGQKFALVCRHWCIVPSQWMPTKLVTLIGLFSFRMHGF